MYAEVLLPLPLEPTFTYQVPVGLSASVSVGSRVVVPFGRGKFYTGIVVALTPVAPEQTFEIKAIASVPDGGPVVRHPQLKLWDWMSAYYLCTRGDVMRAALPAGLKIESETAVEVNPDVDGAEIAATLTDREAHLWQTLHAKGKMTLAQLSRETGVKGIAAMAHRMLAKGAVIVSENLRQRFRPKKETCVRVAIPRGDEEALRRAFAEVAKAPKQELVFMTLVEMTAFTRQGHDLTEVTRADLLERTGATTPIVAALAQKGLVEVYTRETARFRYTGPVSGQLPTLSQPQQTALAQIHQTFKDHKITLLHGVTASGKTEVYMHLIDHVLRNKMQVLYLVPEIALTTQLTARIQRVFGDKVVIYHSRFSDNERAETWQRLLRTGEPCVVIGARSAVFLPFAKLGLVIVDEEHESSYKQYDPAPRYNARDVAIMLAAMHGAGTLLGSATPSVETYYKAQTGKFGLVELTERYAPVPLPAIQVIDMTRARKAGQVQGPFARDTVAQAREHIRAGGQVIFFHNRRGYAPLARCKACAFVPKCQNCDVSLTVHRRTGRLVCHYCGFSMPIPETCPNCQEPAIDTLGFGTERIEDDVQETFSDARTLRMDLDTTRNKDDLSQIIDAFSQHRADILVGTQMVTKGLDFAGVSMVGVLGADAVINYPDFRAAERAFNMLEQVSGRAGRQGRGAVVVQTADPSHPVIRFLREHDYRGFYGHEIQERQAFSYPPFARIIYIYLKHRDARVADDIAARYGAELRTLLGNRVFGPEEPHVARVQNLYIRKIMLKIEPQASMARVKELLRATYVRLMQDPALRGLTLHYDVDPQ